ncbi:unnamed protein product [Mycena citricolor]|uniref:ATP-dependent RNA helicase n=1 Tax=Mycena citricolor TaxID=2018698 RepID=A0AAD2HXT5_9AGAR|nr:unnamed protein product [Mycena citricolor]
MSPAVAAKPAPADQTKEKTKAKQRYLKRKKQRRKGKGKSTTGASSSKKDEDGESQDEEDEDEEAGEADIMEVEVPQDSVQEAAAPTKIKTPKEKRPKKRQKLDTGEEDAENVEMEVVGDLTAAVDELELEPAPALLSFPLPSHPNAPSKSDLALQGLDKALVGAEIVDAGRVVAIPLDEDDDAGTGLREKTRKRLAELGITELFAVQTSLLPFLLPPDLRQRSLYLPFDPPRDVCVSAPTGSGKTLAYVLPILEVIDEADRLLAQSFQDWLAQVLSATRPPSVPKTLADRTPRHPDAVSPAFRSLLSYALPPWNLERKESSCQKLLFSATLTSDPGKLAALNLRDPKYFVVQEKKEELDVVMDKFSFPATLTENMLVCEPSIKPLVFFHLVFKHGVSNAVVFAKSAESTARLVKLFDFFDAARRSSVGHESAPLVVRAYSSDLGAGERKTILDKFKAKEIDILVCSDLISRGIDISHVSHVVSYDVPVDIRKYVHRVGRTARAGREGVAWTLVEEQEARFFKNMLREADHLDRVKRVRVGETDLAPLSVFYEVRLFSCGHNTELNLTQGALLKLKESYSR